MLCGGGGGVVARWGPETANQILHGSHFDGISRVDSAPLNLLTDGMLNHEGLNGQWTPAIKDCQLKIRIKILNPLLGQQKTLQHPRAESEGVAGKAVRRACRHVGMRL